MAKMEKHDGFIKVTIGGENEFDISHLLTPEENAEREAWLKSRSENRTPEATDEAIDKDETVEQEPK